MFSIVILTKNSERTLLATLEATRPFEVILIDSGSTDSTLEIARTFQNVAIEQVPFTGFGPLRNLGARHASNDWILAIDSDEIPSKELIREISSLTLDSDCIYSFPFRNYFNKKWIKCCGWYPDYHARLYDKNRTHFSSDRVHEKVLKNDLREVRLKGWIDHFSYLSISDLLAKMQTYSELFALQYQGKKRSSFWKALFHGWGAFFKAYLLQRGCLSGVEGYLISLYKGQTAFYKYLKLRETHAHTTRTPLP